MAAVEFINRQIETEGLQEVGVGGWVLMARVNESFTMTSDCPDTYLEDGTVVQDHINNKALTLSIDCDISNTSLHRSDLGNLQEKSAAEIGNITQYVPERTASQVQRANELINDALDKARQIDKAIDDGRQAIDFLGGKGAGSKDLQEQFIDAMEALHHGKQLISADMPYRQYKNIRLTTVAVSRDNKTNSLKVKLTGKQIRFAETLFVDLSSLYKSPAAGLNGQTAGEVDKGPQEGKSLSRSAATAIFDFFSGD